MQRSEVQTAATRQHSNIPFSPACFLTGVRSSTKVNSATRLGVGSHPPVRPETTCQSGQGSLCSRRSGWQQLPHASSAAVLLAQLAA